MLIPDAQLLKLLLVALRLVRLLEDLQKAPIVALQDRVLRGHVQRPACTGASNTKPLTVREEEICFWSFSFVPNSKLHFVNMESA